jgi:hypothetical protein
MYFIELQFFSSIFFFCVHCHTAVKFLGNIFKSRDESKGVDGYRERSLLTAIEDRKSKLSRGP